MSNKQALPTKYSIDYLTILLHISLLIAVSFLTTTAVFKFVNHHLAASSLVREQNILITVLYQREGFDNVLREKREIISYALSLISGALLTLASFHFFREKICGFLARFQRSNIDFFVVTISTILLLALLYFEPLINRYLVLYPTEMPIALEIVMILVSVLFFNLAVFYQVCEKKIFRLAIKIIYITASISLSLLIASYLVFDENSKSFIDYSLNFSAVNYPIIQQYLGKELLIDFKSLYGLHPLFGQFVLFIFPAKILTLSLYMAALFFLSLLALALVIFASVKNKIIALFGFFTLIFLQNFSVDGRFAEDGVNFQYEPIRLVFPTLLLAYLVYFFARPSALKYYCGLAFFALATLWNLDSGIPTFLTLLIVFAYDKCRDGLSVKVIKPVLFHLASCAVALLLPWITLFVFLKMKSGIWPQISWIAYGQSSAYDFAYSMLPVFFNGPWIAVVLIYMIGLTMSLYNLFNKNHSLQNNLMFAATILGLGLFTYFLGRSHFSNIMHCGYPAAIVLTIFADKFCTQLQGKYFVTTFARCRFDLVLLSLPLLFVCYISAVFLFEISNNKVIRDKFVTQKFTHKNSPEDLYWLQQFDFIEEKVGATDAFARDDILMLTTNDQDYYFDLMLRAKSPLSVVNIRHTFYQEEMNSILAEISKAKQRWIVVIQSDRQGVLPIVSANEMSQIQQTIKQNYHVNSRFVKAENSVMIYEKN